MNLPNKLTILRVIMIPFFVLTLLYDGGENQTPAVCGRSDLHHCQPDRYAGRKDREEI